MRFKNVVQTLIFAIFLSVSTIGFSQEHNGHKSDHSEHKTEKARCAFDGMPMKTSAMIKTKIKGKTRYFCSSAEADLFKAHPDRYLRTIKIGHLTANLNFLTIAEYKKGMGGMIAAEKLVGKTHHVSLYMTQHGKGIELGDVIFTLKIDDGSGKQKQSPLIFNKMMKTFDANVTLPKNGKTKIRLAIITKPIEM